MQYQLKPFRKSVQCQLHILPRRIRQEVIDIILDLAYDPFPPAAEELRDTIKVFTKSK
jgi:hypothetical protein